MEVTETWYLLLSALLFSIGLVGLLVRRNPLIMFMCVELMLNAVNISFVAFSELQKKIPWSVVTGSVPPSVLW